MGSHSGIICYKLIFYDGKMTHLCESFIVIYYLNYFDQLIACAIVTQLKGFCSALQFYQLFSWLCSPSKIFSAYDM